MKSIFQIFIYSIFLILVISTKNIFSDEMSGGHENAKMFIEEKRYIEAEKLAISLLTNNPSDVTAEYILTSAWVGLGREEAKKGNLDKAIELLQKARQKWPFDQDLKKEIELLGNISSKKNIPSNSSQNRRSNGSQTVILLDSKLFRSIDDLKSELHSTIVSLKDTHSYNKEQESFSKKEILFLGLILIFTLVSFCNLYFTFLLWKRR
ncbi:tetratricopeptide repeat protein (plasmid) [Leptospira interrogans]|uniref:tetratricopeptide repeat protein n=1 Tax=Leptospira interrogans TaxID=173 RepID=UPI001EF1070C|nr:tetratricopeptide repeat protein [Leptospira interrogans]ULG82582.1 tetratricopeptide repeat protein [Leptospira interrogans]ULG82589.1 tetratricopeptide repeat protein [Leptospira interrogans]UML67420.1 tetratricopeptide repeat protein [Leptospira interrogans]